ncbi:MAG TPA: VWA domain-containing protein [Burkholderiaceae bacterium]|jgi:Ca-activated chloride channel family protein|nr:VWA domain-containing protein [Burkholderiaceae bacterium]
MTLQLAWPWLLAALPLPLLAWWLPAATAVPPAALRFPFPGVLQAAHQGPAARRSRLLPALAALAWLMLVLAAARPQQVGETVHVPVTGRSLMLAVDLSGSMQTPDMQLGGRDVSRLEAVKSVAGDFIERRAGDRIGLILFGDQAYVQAPLTLDRATVHTLLDEAQIGLAGQQTAIGDAIGLAIKRLRSAPAGNRVLVLLTDGASNAGSVDPLKAADLAAQEGVRIYTIGVGSDEVVLRGPFGLTQTVQGDLDEDVLKTIASKTGGQYFRAADIASLKKIYADLDRIEPMSKDAQSWRPIDELYMWPLGAALLLSVLIALRLAGPGIVGIGAAQTTLRGTGQRRA